MQRFATAGALMAGLFMMSSGMGLAETRKAKSRKISWLMDYGKAMKDAKSQRKMMFIYFRAARRYSTQSRFESSALAHPYNRRLLSKFVAVRLSRSLKVKVKGRLITLLGHPAFREMQGGPGVAVIDFTHPKSRYYGHVVSTIPFHSRAELGAYGLSVLLQLPKGSLTQRTMVFAVRTHPEQPGSTTGQFHPTLAAETASHSIHQASITLQGHHRWDFRFQRINARLPYGLMAQEVVAESWPGQGLVDACVDCVHSWRQSSGHWSAVYGRHPYYGYDIRLGGNGIWYATGIFARYN